MDKENYEYLAREVNQIEADQRISDGYIKNATALCKASNKRMKNYLENATTKYFLSELSRSVGIPTIVIMLVISNS